ncbi:hypothetical protein ACQEU5_24985 [Marinactinospora thermotolerans]|uniref:hypothetical protein n=1 Tax=Marinactinospora thermotolerans TaxID=531310 RepID=UPI003D93DE60
MAPFYRRLSAAMILAQGDSTEELARLVRSRLKDDSLVEAAIDRCRAEIAVLREAAEVGLVASVHADLEEVARYDPSKVHLQAVDRLRTGQIDPQGIPTLNHLVEILAALLYLTWMSRGGSLDDLIR